MKVCVAAGEHRPSGVLGRISGSDRNIYSPMMSFRTKADPLQDFFSLFGLSQEGRGRPDGRLKLFLMIFWTGFLDVRADLGSGLGLVCFCVSACRRTRTWSEGAPVSRRRCVSQVLSEDGLCSENRVSV